MKTEEVNEKPSDLTASELEYSMKVSRQVAEKALKDEQKALSKRRDELQIEARNELEQFNIEERVKSLFKAQLNKCKGTSLIVAGINELRDDHEAEIKSNDEMLVDSSVFRMNYIFHSGSYTKEYARAIEEGIFYLGYAMHFGYRDAQERREDSRDSIEGEFVFCVQLTKAMIEDLASVAPKLQEADRIAERQSEVRYKLRNIDETLKEIEAELLVNELSRTQRGREVLDVTSRVISNVIGETPALLSNK